MRILLVIMAIAAVGGLGAYLILQPRPLGEADIPAHQADLANGERMFNASGCSGCHAAPGAEGDATLVLAGGQALRTPFGTFYVPNISPSAKGIRGWSDLDFVNAVKLGISPGKRHYFPAFPYTSYQRMRIADILDLKAYIDTLPPVDSVAPPHDLPIQYSSRLLLGGWKLLYLDGKTFEPDPAAGDPVNLGAYLVEGAGHCGECHTPRDALGGLKRDRWLAGAPNPEGKGFIPNITQDESGIGSWSETDIAYALESGFTPEFDSLGGSMAEIVRHTAKLPSADREAIAGYLKSIPPLPADRGGDMSEGGQTAE